MNLADKAILLALKNIPEGAYGAYTTLKVTYPSLPIFSVFYKLLSPESKNKIKNFVKEDGILSKFYIDSLIRNRNNVNTRCFVKIR